MKYLPLLSVLCMLGCIKAPSASPETEKPFPFVTKSEIEMTFLPGGEFTMGNDQGEADEQPTHRVQLTPFAIDKFEVTHDWFAKSSCPIPPNGRRIRRGRSINCVERCEGLLQ